MNLYLKYRPKTISELDLTSVRESLEAMVKTSNLGHAYLFTGPRGAGKTSTARIMARIANCEDNGGKLGEPCNKCVSCKSILSGSAMDVIEIDAASNRGIDDVRELKEKIGLAPSSLTKKVYIIDEVHMMTVEAFNALLKTLEEPPEHAVFILCTTEAHKVPETIASRCSRILFAKASKEEMIRSFGRVVKGEKASVSKEALELLATSVDGSFRDGVKVLDQVLGKGGEVGVEEMEEALYGSSGYSVSELAQALVEQEMVESLAKLTEATNQGVDLVHLIVSLIRELRIEVLAGKVELARLITQLDRVARKLSTSPVPVILLEMVVIEWCEEGEEKKQTNKRTNEQTNMGTKQQTKKEEVQIKKVTKAVPVEKSVFAGSTRELWRKILLSINGDSYSLGALLAKATPRVIKGDELVVQVLHSFHRDQIMMEKYRAKIEKMASEIVGQPMRISCEVVEQLLQTPVEEDNILDEAVEIFS